MRPEHHTTARASAHVTAQAAAGWQLVGAGLGRALWSFPPGSVYRQLPAPFATTPSSLVIIARQGGAPVVKRDRMDGVSQGSDQEFVV